MGSMAKIMKQKATTIKATSANCSTEIVKIISNPRLECMILDKYLESAIRQNKNEGKSPIQNLFEVLW